MIIRKKRYHFKGGGVMIEKLLDKLGYISKKELLNFIDILKLASDRTLDVKKGKYDNKEITKWSYYKFFWTQRGIKHASIKLEEYINRLYRRS
jgi:hypothetical protein